MAKEQVSIKLQKDVIDQLKDLEHPGQSYSGIIQELINFYKARKPKEVAMAE